MRSRREGQKGARWGLGLADGGGLGLGLRRREGWKSTGRDVGEEEREIGKNIRKKGYGAAHTRTAQIRIRLEEDTGSVWELGSGFEMRY